MPRHAEGAVASDASSATTQDFTEDYGTLGEPRGTPKRWAPPTALWLALSGVGWVIIIGAGWAVLQAF